MSLREDAEPDGDTADVEDATQGLPSTSSIQLQPPSPPAVMELDKQGALHLMLYLPFHMHTSSLKPSIGTSFFIYVHVFVQHKCIFFFLILG